MHKQGRRILSLDWDWVTGDCSLKQRRRFHCGWCEAYGLSALGPLGRGAKIRKADRGAVETRCAEFMQMLRRLQGYTPSRIRGPVYVAECHADIVGVIPVGADVWTLDAHTDCGDLPLSCGSWETLIECMHGRIHRLGGGVQSYVYPLGRTDPIRRELHIWGGDAVRKFCRVVDAVFICRSSPFTAEEYDGYFNEALSVLKEGHGLTFIGHRAKELQRGYNN